MAGQPHIQRIEREIRQIKKDPSCNLEIALVEDNLCRLKGTFKGPKDTPYEGGTFIVDIQIPDGISRLLTCRLSIQAPQDEV